MSIDQFSELATCRDSPRLNRGRESASTQSHADSAALRKAKKECPATVKTHLRNMPVLPEMVGSIVADEAMADAGIGATIHSSRFIRPLK
uniref:40S ribosomal protein S15 n=1 Tax=Macrostomum lignano TaxID=282301 RepID=A0A1I8F5S6_9PLAT